MSNQDFVDNLKSKGVNSETKLQRKVQNYLRNLGCYEFKVHGNQYMRAGIPDIICCYKGLFIGIETKVGKNKMSELQKIHKEEILNAGGIHILAYTLEDVEKILKNL